MLECSSLSPCSCPSCSIPVRSPSLSLTHPRFVRSLLRARYPESNDPAVARFLLLRPLFAAFLTLLSIWVISCLANRFPDRKTPLWKKLSILRCLFPDFLFLLVYSNLSRRLSSPHACGLRFARKLMVPCCIPHFCINFPLPKFLVLTKSPGWFPDFSLFLIL